MKTKCECTSPNCYKCYGAGYVYESDESIIEQYKELFKDHHITKIDLERGRISFHRLHKDGKPDLTHWVDVVALENHMLFHGDFQMGMFRVRNKPDEIVEGLVAVAGFRNRPRYGSEKLKHAMQGWTEGFGDFDLDLSQRDALECLQERFDDQFDPDEEGSSDALARELEENQDSIMSCESPEQVHWKMAEIDFFEQNFGEQHYRDVVLRYAVVADLILEELSQLSHLSFLKNRNS